MNENLFKVKIIVLNFAT